MSFCPKCRTEFRSGFYKCSDCGSPLVASLSPIPEEGHQDEDELVSVFDPADPLIGQALAALLEDKGIRCILKSEQIPVYANVAMMLRPRWGQLMVLEGNRVRAEDLIKEYLSAPEQENLDGEK